jgi:dTDP-4-dehydrorhamnose 3,5-epimerase-like enzyme
MSDGYIIELFFLFNSEIQESEGMNYKLIDLKVHGDNRGKLVALEECIDIPFQIKRVYWIFDTLPDVNRGFHAHKKIEQFIIAIDGACQFILDDGYSRESIWLNRPDKGLYIGHNMWREIKNFSYGCKLMVLASEYYDEKEYLRNYDSFLKEVCL